MRWRFPREKTEGSHTQSMAIDRLNPLSPVAPTRPVKGDDSKDRRRQRKQPSRPHDQRPPDDDARVDEYV